MTSVGEILFRLHAAARTKRRGHVGCDRAAVESVSAVLGDRAQCACKRRLYEAIALAGRTAAGQEQRVPGATDGGNEQFVEALRAVSLKQQLPAGDGAGDGDAMRRNVIGRSWTRGPDRVERSRSRRAARTVDGDDLAAGRRIEAEAIAAEARRLRLDHREHGTGRNRR